jgi:RNA polymerase sigma factor (sigma-70 family)
MNAFLRSLPDLQRCARRIASRLVRSGAFEEHDVEDLVQELIIDAWVRFQHFDPNRSSTRTFGQKIMSNRASSLIEQRNAAKRGRRIRHETIDPDGDSLPLREHIVTPAQSTDLMIDIAKVVAHLPPDLAKISALLMITDKTSVVQKLRISRRTLHRRIVELRCVFGRAGLGPVTIRGSRSRPAQSPILRNSIQSEAVRFLRRGVPRAAMFQRPPNRL